jgi:predicted Rossmann fold nucleotide-binding protein DprA/Smf involved in DNA uptake
MRFTADHKKLADEILDAGGAIVTQFPLTLRPPRKTFLPQSDHQRLSLGVVVVEAAENQVH